MKIVHLNTEDISGGAARATYRLHTGLKRLGHESSLFVMNSKSNDPTVLTFKPAMDLLTRVRRRVRRRQITRDFARYRQSRPGGCEIFSDDRSEYGADLVRQLPPCDVINLHWIAGFLDYQAFFSSIPQRTPIVWRLADMNPLTGGCHYDDGCGKFKQACGSCPQLGSTEEKDFSRKILERKQAVFRSLEPGRLHIVALCQWMAGQVKQSPLLSKFPVTLIPNGVDTEEFAPRDCRMARELLGIPRDMRVALFAADDAANRRKGFSLLLESLSQVGDKDNVFLVSVGSGEPHVKVQLPHLHLGHVEYRWLSLAYSAADVFVIPSLQDNLPNTVLESMACGTPVIGFAVGGIPDMVRHETTGRLVAPFDVGALRAAIVDLLHDPVKRKEMGVNCRRIAVEEYSLELQARRYSELYKSLL